MNNNNNNKLNTNSLNELFAAAEKASAKKMKKRAVPIAELELALAVVLVDLAGCDQQFAPNEYQVISGGLRRLFSPPKERVKALVNQANVALGNLRGTSRFAALLRDNLDESEKKSVMETIDDLIGIDGAEDGFETYLRNKLSTVLGIKPQPAAAPQK